MKERDINIELTEEKIDACARVFLLRREYLSAASIFKFKMVAFGKTEYNYSLLALAYEAAGEKIKALQIYQEALLAFINNQDFAGRINQLKAELN